MSSLYYSGACMMTMLLANNAIADQAMPAAPAAAASDQSSNSVPSEPRPWLQQLLYSLISPASAVASSSVSGDYRTIVSDGLPDHPTGRFPNTHNPSQIHAQTATYQVPAHPVYYDQTVALGLWPFGVAINGVPFDPGTAEFWNRDPSSGWRYEALNGAVDLGLDGNHAHVQPNGSYHYHGVPVGLLARLDDDGAPQLIGYAADGFPIYGPQGYRTANRIDSGMVTLRSGYRLKQGQRPGGDAGPGGRYDGSFVQDYEYQPGLGDLDSCNGRYGVTPEYPDGSYYYVISESYPYIPRCFHGDPDRSLQRYHRQRRQQGSNPQRSHYHRDAQTPTPNRTSTISSGSIVTPASSTQTSLTSPSTSRSQSRPPGPPPPPPGAHAGGRHGGHGGPEGGHHRPPPEAFAACRGRSAGASASFRSPHGDTVSGTCQQRHGELFLVPNHGRPPR